MPLYKQLLIVFGLGLAGALGAGWWFVAANEKGSAEAPVKAAAQRQVPVEVARVRIGEVRDTLEVVGTTRARQSIDLVANVSGRVVEIHFEAGQEVAPGQPLVRLDDVIESANVEEARALLADTRTQLERARQLLVTRNVPQARVDELASTHAAALARLRAAERRLQERVVKAPFGGIVGLREVDAGARVSEDTKLTRLEDRSLMELEFQVPELFYGRIKRGQQVRARSTALPGDEFLGSVSVIETRIDEVSRAFRVRAELPNPDGVIPAGLFMVTRIVLASRPRAQLIPEQAIMQEGRSSFVFRVRAGRAERVEVRLGRRQLGEVEVVAGLDDDDVIVVAGIQRLRAGTPVRILNEIPAGNAEPGPVAEGGG